jgi:uncharacterized membrane protein
MSAAIDLKTLARLAGYLLLGGLGALALLTPLAGVLAYLATPFYPLLLGWFLYGGVLAVTRHSRMARVYVFANFGVLLATLIASVASLVRLAVSSTQPDTRVTAPLYLALVLAGLVIGTAVGYRRHTAPARSH